jgi:hypothetical protein
MGMEGRVVYFGRREVDEGYGENEGNIGILRRECGICLISPRCVALPM